MEFEEWLKRVTAKDEKIDSLPITINGRDYVLHDVTVEVRHDLDTDGPDVGEFTIRFDGTETKDPEEAWRAEYYDPVGSRFVSEIRRAVLGAARWRLNGVDMKSPVDPVEVYTIKAGDVVTAWYQKGPVIVLRGEPLRQAAVDAHTDRPGAKVAEFGKVRGPGTTVSVDEFIRAVDDDLVLRLRRAVLGELDIAHASEPTLLGLDRVIRERLGGVGSWPPCAACGFVHWGGLPLDALDALEGQELPLCDAAIEAHGRDVKTTTNAPSNDAGTPMVEWRIFDEDAGLINVVYYAADCDADYVRRAEDLSPRWCLERRG